MIIDTLKNLTVKIGSGSTPSGGKDSYKDSGISLIRSMNVYDFKFEKKGLAFIDENQAKKLDGVKVEENDILFNITGDSINRTCIVPKEILPSRVNQHVSIIRCKKGISPQYVNYFLIYLKPYLMQICGVGGTRNAITKEVLEKLQIKIQSNQFEIAKVLSDLDAKIELNNKINAELEAMAKLIYDYWFVQFDFPYEFKTVKTDKEGRRTEFIEVKPYKSSGGKMVWSEELKREIPEGWEVKELGSCIEIFDSLRIPLSSRDRENRKGKYPYYGATSIMDYVKDYIFDDEYILVAEDGSVMDERGFPIIQFIWGKTWVNNHAHVIQAKIKSQNEFYFQLIKMIPVVLIKTGSIQMKINQENLKKYKVLIPRKELIDSFSEKANSMRKTLINNIEQNQKLSELRDWLLPMLMNGQVKVK